jgi:hypothetical protein
VKDQANITTMKDIAISLKQNKPGELAKAVAAIANAQVNIEGFSEIDGKFHCVTDDPKKVKQALESAGFPVSESDVLVFAAEDRPGYLANLLRGIAEQEVNVVTSYVLTNTRIALGVDQPARVKETLQQELTPQAAHHR